MTYSFDGFNYLVRLDKGERLSEALLTFVAKSDIQGAWVMGVGGALEATLGFYELDTKTYHWQEYQGLYEIVSLSGNLAFDQDGTFVFHLHGVLADRQFKTVGGHIKDLVAAATVELFVHATEKPLRRAMNQQVGLKTLDTKE